MPLLTCPHCGSAVTTRDIETAPLRCPVCGAALTSAPVPGPASGPAPAPAPAALPIQEAEVRDASYHSGWQDREEDDSATRAIARDKLEPITAQARTDHSYDQRAQATDEAADEATHALAYAPVATDQRVQPDQREATHALPLSAIPQEAPPARRGPGLRAAIIALAGAALVVVIVVAALAGNGLLPSLFGGSPTPAPTATGVPTSTPSTAFSVKGLYALSYPTGWVVQTQLNAAPQSYFALLSSGGDASVSVEAQQISPAPSNLAALDEQAISTLAQPGTSPGNFSSATTITIGGQAWTRVTGDAQLIVPSGQPPTYGHVAALSTQRGSYTYTILCVSTASSADAARAAFTTDDASAFQPLLASFSFLG